MRDGRGDWRTPAAVLIGAAMVCATLAHGDAAGRAAAASVREELLLTRGELAAMREAYERRTPPRYQTAP